MGAAFVKKGEELRIVSSRETPVQTANYRENMINSKGKKEGWGCVGRGDLGGSTTESEEDCIVTIYHRLTKVYKSAHVVSGTQSNHSSEDLVNDIVSYKDRIYYHMFTNNQRQEERTGKYGTPRVQYLQELVAQFQNASTEASKEKIVANLANFAYDPFNYTFLRQLNVLELFLDCVTEPNEKLIEFGAGGICNSCVDPANAAVIIKCDGVPLLVQCLSSPVKNTLSLLISVDSIDLVCEASLL
ncbi:armadillo repeat-containing protein 7 [Tanacetum coccineum]